MTRPILSIGLIVKNESRHLRNCLNAIKPLMHKVKCELIIADTGSTDDTVAIAREFTNHVIEIPWNNNFAEARNHTLRAATGEWFMYIDADEYMEDGTALIRFFTNGTYKRHTGAGYYRRELFSSEANHSTYIVHRLSKITKGLRFIGVVHEHLDTEGYFQVLDSYFIHHGYYDVEDPEILEKKLRRNLPLLQQAYEEDPMDVVPLNHLASSYITLGEMDKAKECIDLSLELLKDDIASIRFPAVYRTLIAYHATPSRQDYPKAIAAADEYLALRPKPTAATIEIYIDKAGIHYKMDDYKAAADAYGKAFDLLKLHLAKKLNIEDINSALCTRVNDSYPGILALLLHACHEKLGEYDKAFDWLGQVPLAADGALVHAYHGLIAKSGEPHRFAEVFARLTRLHGTKGDTVILDKCLETFNMLILPQKNVARLLEPFFDDYLKVIYRYLSRKQLINTDADIASLSGVYQVIYHLHQADLLKSDKPAAMTHIKAAIRADSRFVPLITPRMRK